MTSPSPDRDRRGRRRTHVARGHAVEPVHLPGGDRYATSPGCSSSSGSSPSPSRSSSRPSSPGASRPAAPPDRGLPRLAEGDLASRVPPTGRGRRGRDLRAVAPVQRHGRPAPGERRDHPPRPRSQPRLPRRRLARAADPDRRAADVQRAAHGARRRRSRRAGRVPRVEPPAARAPRLAGPEPARALEARLRARPARPAARTTCGPRSRSAVEQAEATARAARRRRCASSCPPSRSGSATTRSGSARSSTNLVGNALKFTPRGGSVERRARSRRRTAPGSRWRDTGVGIDPAELPHIFDRFYRGSPANEARGSGSGLGLAIVKSIVDMHGGTDRRREPARRGHDVHGHAAAGSAAASEAPPRGEPSRGRRATVDGRRPAGGGGYFTVSRPA